MRFIVRVGDKIGQRDVIAQLIRMQYQRNDTDFSRGNFRVRGDTIDVFPAEHSELAIRLELFDDEIDSLSLLDPLTGRIRQKIPRFVIYPSSHYVTPRDRVLAAIETIKEELRQRTGRVRGRWQAGGGPAHRAAHPLRPGDECRRWATARASRTTPVTCPVPSPVSRRPPWWTTCRPMR